MLKNQTLGLVLVILGVLANNYVYLHDLILDKHGGAILLQWKSQTAIVATLVVVAIGVIIIWASRANAASEQC